MGEVSGWIDRWQKHRVGWLAVDITQSGALCRGGVTGFTETLYTQHTYCTSIGILYVHLYTARVT